MRKVFLSFALATVCTMAAAQEPDPAQSVLKTSSPVTSWSADLAMWGYATEEAFTPASWNMIYFDDNLFEVRYNFDQTDALSLFYGHRLTKDGESMDISFTPALGFTKYGSSSNIGLTTHTIFEGESWKFYTINQHSLPTSPCAETISYHWIDFGYHLTDWLLIGASEQYYQVGENEGNLDLGPSLGLELDAFYAKAFAWDFWNADDRYIGIWCGFYFTNEE